MSLITPRITRNIEEYRGTTKNVAKSTQAARFRIVYGTCMGRVSAFLFFIAPKDSIFSTFFGFVSGRTRRRTIRLDSCVNTDNMFCRQWWTVCLSSPHICALNYHAVEMSNESFFFFFFFFLGGGGGPRECLPHRYTKAFLIFLVHWQIFTGLLGVAWHSL